MEEIIINEEWRSISGYLIYQVSNIGRVRNTTNGRILQENIDADGYVYFKLSLKGKKTHHVLHRLVALEFIPNPMNKPTVDHINNKEIRNNTVGNLRWATRQEQERNKSKRLNTSSQYKGVSWDKRESKWEAYITIDGRKISLGYFKSEEEAGLAYNKQAILHFGEFVKPNVIDLLGNVEQQLYVSDDDEQRWSSSSHSLRNMNDNQDVQDSSKALKILILIIIIALIHKHYINL